MIHFSDLTEKKLKIGAILFRTFRQEVIKCFHELMPEILGSNEVPDSQTFHDSTATLLGGQIRFFFGILGNVICGWSFTTP